MDGTLECIPGHEEGQRDGDEKASFTAEFMAKVVMEALRGDRTIQAIAAKHEIRPNQISGWKRQAQDGQRELFADGRSRRQEEHDATIHDLHAEFRKLDRCLR